MPPAEKRDWGEWGRFTVTAIGSSALTMIASSFWLGGTVNELHAATEAIGRNGSKIEKLADISADLKNLIIHLSARSEIHDEQIKMLQDAMRGKDK